MSLSYYEKLFTKEIKFQFLQFISKTLRNVHGGIKWSSLFFQLEK
jgi:hypothetical protein